MSLKLGKRNAFRSLALLIATCGVFIFGCSNGSKTVKDSDRRDEAADLNMQLGLDYYRQGNLQQAKEKLERAMEQNPRNAQAQMVAGLLYDRLNNQKEADAHFSRAISLDPKNPEIRNNYAVFLCGHGQVERGEKLALESAADPLYKTPEAAYLNAGYCARSAKDLKRAEQHFRRALAVRPRFTPALLEMADLEFQSKNYLPARAFLERYMAAQPPSPTALWLGVRIEKALGNRGIAGDYARRMKNDFPTADETKLLIESERRGG